MLYPSLFTLFVQNPIASLFEMISTRKMYMHVFIIKMVSSSEIMYDGYHHQIHDIIRPKGKQTI